MRFYQFKNIAESKGVFGRKAGDPYVNSSGVTGQFISVEAYPPVSEGGKFDSIEARDEAIKTYEENRKIKIEFVNAATMAKRGLAFGVAVIRTSDGQDIYFGKYLTQVGADLMGAWKNNELPDGWKLATKGAQKLETGLDPQTLIGTPNFFKGPQSIINHVSRKAPPESKDILTNALKTSAEGKYAVFPGQREQLTAIRDYFGEIMGPVAMMGGAVTGNAIQQAQKDLAGGAAWQDLDIFWPQSMNYNLADSIFKAPDGKDILISSKGGSGAAASSKNLHDSLEKARGNTGFPKNDELLKELDFIPDIIDTIAQQPAKNAPYILGVKFGLSTEKLQAEANRLMKEGGSSLEGLSKEASDLMAGVNFDTTSQGFNIGYALTSALAKKVANHVNADPRFSKEAIALLNTASIIQLYTKVGVKGEDVMVTSYDAVYPPNFSGTVLLDGSKNYYSSRVGGKFAFRFK